MEGSAAVIGEMMLPVLEPTSPAATAPARSLGLAFQLTNFLRDVGEDLDRGRVYMPQEDLDRFGVDITLRRATPEWQAFLAYEIERNRALYAFADTGIALLPPRSARCVGTARVLYSRILDRIEAADYDVFSTRARVPTWRKAATAARILVAGPPKAAPARSWDRGAVSPRPPAEPAAGRAAGKDPQGPTTVNRRRAVRAGEATAPRVQQDGKVWRIRSAAAARQILAERRATTQAGFTAESIPKGYLKHHPILVSDGPLHDQQRSKVGRFFAPKVVAARYSTVMADTADRLLAEATAQPVVRLDDLALLYTVEVTAQAVGLTDSPVPAMAKRLVSFFNQPPFDITKDDLGRTNRDWMRAAWNGLLPVLRFYLFDVRPAIRRRRRRPAGGRDQPPDRRGLHERRHPRRVRHLRHRGHGHHPGVHRHGRVAPAAAPRAADRYLVAQQPERLAILNEIIRLEPVVGHLYRRVQQPLSFDDQGATFTAEPGDLVDLCVRTANADSETVGAEPLDLCPQRPLPSGVDEAVLSFGHGAHRCPGQPLAMMESDVLLHRLLAREVTIASEPTIEWDDLIAGYKLSGFDVWPGLTARSAAAGWWSDRITRTAAWAAAMRSTSSSYVRAGGRGPRASTGEQPVQRAGQPVPGAHRNGPQVVAGLAAVGQQPVGGQEAGGGGPLHQGDRDSRSGSRPRPAPPGGRACPRSAARPTAPGRPAGSRPGRATRRPAPARRSARDRSGAARRSSGSAAPARPARRPARTRAARPPSRRGWPTSAAPPARSVPAARCCRADRTPPCRGTAARSASTEPVQPQPPDRERRRAADGRDPRPVRRVADAGARAAAPGW